jgi:sporulation protein YlmC with PRC-barrel domain
MIKMNVSKIWLTLAIVAVSFGPLRAQGPTASQATSSVNENLHKLDSTTSGHSIRVSKLIGLKIYNSGKQHVGQIKDIVVNPTSARVQYVAVSYGGFLGLGDNLFAVPIQAMQIKQDPDNMDNVLLILDVTKEQMNGAKGFDETNWPNFSDGTFVAELHRRYRIEDRWNHVLNRDGLVDVEVDSNGVKVNVDRLLK